MDVETAYDSDISESWSLIDINLNEEPLLATDVPSTVEKTQSPEFKSTKLKKTAKTELQDSGRKSQNLIRTESSQIIDSDSDTCFKNQDIEVCSRTDRILSSPQNLDDNEKNDSGDAESIEILDMDGNYQESEIDRLDVATLDQYDFAGDQSQDEGSSDGRALSASTSNSSAVIKRKRRRDSRDPEKVVQNLYSDIRPTCSSYSQGESCKFMQENHHSDRKRFQRNVFKLILSLLLSAFFALITCIALGHCLGIHDATETAMELMETLKKLQVEHAALQSSIVHLKKALLTLETNPKLELPIIHQPQTELSCEETRKANPSITQMQADLNNAALSEIRSSLNSIEWLSKLQNVGKKGTETANAGIDINGFGKHIHDQLNLLKERKKDGAKLSEDTDVLLVLKKLLLVLKKMMSRLSSSYDNIEIMHEKLNKLKRTINHKLDKFFRESSGERNHEDGVTATEFDSETVQSTPQNRMQMNLEQNPSSGVLYKFPQLQNYYEVERDSEGIEKTPFETSNSNNTHKTDSHDEKVEYFRRNKKKHKEFKNEKKKEKRLGKKSFKKEKNRKGDKKRKSAPNKFYEVTEDVENNREMKSKHVEPENLKFVNSFNESDSSKEKKHEKLLKHKRKAKKVKNSKSKKVLYSKVKKEVDFKKNKYESFCSDSQCFNLTGYWVFKWADGRKEFRRHQTLGDWQFDRAKARKEMRNEDFRGNWQFKRALARENNRNFDRSRQGRYTKYNGNEFFQERFSWILRF